MILRALQTLLLLLCVSACAAAPAPRPLLTDYTHTAWTELDGAPSGVTKFAQGPDGWLWIATPTGLYRFDGVRFERADTVHGQPLQSSNLMALTTTPDGAVWVGYRIGGISVFRADGATHYGASAGLRLSGVMHLEAAPDGALWAAMRDGVAVLPKGARRFRYLGREVGLPENGIFQILFARDGTTWIGTNKGAWFRRQGETRFTQAWPRKTLVSLCEAPDGTIWGNDFAKGYYRVHTVAPPAGTADTPELAGISMRYDRGGTMWVTQTDRVERVLDPGTPAAPDQRLDALNGISGPMIGATFQDREGNLWIGTSRGIDRLRPNRLRTLPAPRQLEYPALVAGPEGDIWVGDYAADLWRYGLDGPLRREPTGALTAGYTAPDGVVWLGGTENLLRRGVDGTWSAIAYPVAAHAMRVHALQQDCDGALWVAFSTGRQLYKLAGDRWLQGGGVTGLPDLLTTSMARDADGNVWMAHPSSTVTIVAGNAARNLGPDQGLRLGTVMTLAADGRAMWAGGENGVTLYRNGRFDVLRGERDEAFRGVSGIVRLPGGDLWLHGAAGLYRIAAPDLARWLANPGEAVPFERFDAQDGMQGHAPQLRPVPSLRRDRDGVLWFATTGTVGTIDPARILRNPLAPPVHIIGVLADGVRHAPAGNGVLALPQGTRNLQVEFTALSLSMPERVRLRYRLIGLDPAWQEASGHRQAYYTNLAPGSYRFEVIASNEDNLWNTAGATLAIDIPPTFVQSGWFKLLLAVAALLLLSTAYALRIRFITQRMQERLQERLTERTRIARALHDTLLQSIQSLLLSFDAHTRRLQEGTPERNRLDQTLNLAERLLVEGRDQIMALRASSSPEVLELTLGQFGKGLAAHRPHAFDMRILGTPRQLQADVHEEIYVIAREALFNASHYADAASIELELDYGDTAFVLRIRDDGCGIDEAVAAAGHRPGHFGLIGMRERAACIGAALAIVSRSGVGTEITVTVPSGKAYAS
ncbi:two component regulator with propeller domain [Pseudoduganella flava]|uniref:Histidine kinase n=1 Tax=Pseudoduganella flava TaxID=871742 RepID=A0A562Q0V2_9BURK|nr:sensor histidine kinase [Pseudoduganella flava]QGZ38191.1 histidine kinase [Pseudoduganella flava]TWI50284.1 two component regulator with propeller domain [Pseudoduganella flava]